MMWPAWPSDHDAQLLALLYQFEETEWWEPEAIAAMQLVQLRQLLTHFRATSPFFYQHYGDPTGVPYQDIDWSAFRELPTLTKQDIRNAGDALYNKILPSGHHTFRYSSSSGFSGTPVVIRKTEINQIFHEALNLRNHLWHERDFGASFASVCRFEEDRHRYPQGSILSESWVSGFHSGPSLALNSAFCTIDEQLDWLFRHQPAYLLSYPSLLFELAMRCKRQGLRPEFLKGLMTFGEVITDVQRKYIKRYLGVNVRDTYSASEVSKIAIQCPDHEGHYHVMAESLLVEILDDDGNPCRPGQVGRVVITDLHNFVTPMIRYEIGDRAIAGSRCDCGRGLPVIQGIVGRTLEPLRLANGDSLIPDVERQDFVAIAPIEQLQVVQRSYTEVDVYLVMERELTPGEAGEVKKAIGRALHYIDFDMALIRVDEIKRSESGKFAMFVCDMDSEEETCLTR